MTTAEKFAAIEAELAPLLWADHDNDVRALVERVRKAEALNDLAGKDIANLQAEIEVWQDDLRKAEAERDEMAQMFGVRMPKLERVREATYEHHRHTGEEPFPCPICAALADLEEKT
jgi:hypothetical protein